MCRFDRSTIDFATEFKVLDKLLESTRDLRLFTLYVRLLALSRDLAGVSECMAAIAALVSTRWDDINPKGEGGDYGLRTAVLQALDDMPTVILPLQHMPLVTTRRAGMLTYRSVMVAKGETAARAGETAIDQAGIERALSDEEPDALQATRDRWGMIGTAAETIRLTSIEKAGFEQAVTLDRLPDLVKKVLSVLDPILVARNPGAAPLGIEAGQADAADTPASGAASSRPGAGTASAAIKTSAAAARALGAVGRYLNRFEPSSPAALIVRQAQDLVGKSFYEVIRILVPSEADDAKISIGPAGLFKLNYDHLSSAHDAIQANASSEAEDPTDEPDQHAGSASAEAEPVFEVRSRQQAGELLDQVGAFFRRAEPSSPIPNLIDRAKSFLDRDFLTILRDILPKLGDRDS